MHVVHLCVRWFPKDWRVISEILISIVIFDQKCESETDKVIQHTSDVYIKCCSTQILITNKMFMAVLLDTKLNADYNFILMIDIFFFLGKWQNFPGKLLENLDFFKLIHYVFRRGARIIFMFENIWMVNVNEIFYPNSSEHHVYRIQAHNTSLMIKRNLGQ